MYEMRGYKFSEYNTFLYTLYLQDSGDQFLRHSISNRLLSRCIFTAIPLLKVVLNIYSSINLNI